MRLTWDKRYITLGPVATLLGLAFRLYDPEQPARRQRGPRHHLRAGPDRHAGREHRPAPPAAQRARSRTARTRGKDVFMPLDWIIGGADYAGKGWQMLMECLAAGRSISLPTSSVGGVKALARFTGAYARVRRQFKTPIGKLRRRRGGARRASPATAYMMDATRVHDRRRGRPGREAGGALGDRQVPHDRARARRASTTRWTSTAARASASGRTTSSAAATRRRRSRSRSKAPTS